MNGADYGRRGRRRGDHSFPRALTETIQGAGQLFLDELAHLVQFAWTRRVCLEKHLMQAYRAQWTRHRFPQVPTITQDDLRAAATDVNHERAMQRFGPA